MTERTRNIVVGLTALVGLAGLVVMILAFGDLPQWTRTGYPLQVTFPDADGLSPGSRVRLAGIDVGRVEQVRLQEPAHLGVVVHANIEQDVDIPRSVKPVVLRPLLGGSAVLSLEVSHLTAAQAGDALPRDGSMVLTGRTNSMMGDLATNLQQALEGPSEQFERMSERFASLSEQWEQVGANLNQLIEPRMAGDVDAGRAQGNLSSVLARTDRRLAELEQVLSGIGRYVNDEQLHDDVRSTVQHARQVAQQAVKLTASAQTHVDDLATRFVAAADDFSKAMQQANALMHQASQGQGAIGRFVNDPALYDNLNDAAMRLQTTLDEVVLLVQKWKQEGLPVQF